MRDLDDIALERRLRGVLKEHLGALPLDLTVEAVERRREARGVARRSTRGRGIALLAAAALLGGGAVAAGSGILRLPSVVPPVPSPSFVAVATTSPEAASPSPGESVALPASPIPAAGPAGVWIPIGTMGRPRSGHTAVRLLDGRVLVVGGATDDPTDTSAELYDPNTGTWTATEHMLRPYEGFPATLLQDGKVLVGDEDRTADGSVNGAEVYDPASGTWTATEQMVWGGGGLASATLLRDGTVLIRSDGGSELYDPGTRSWTATRSRATQRHSHAAILLPDGKVLAAGGHAPADKPAATAELYDPDTGSWTVIASMHRDREAIESFLQPDGTVLVVGGPYGGPQSAELYDPTTGTWIVLAERTELGYQRATLLSNGTLLATGRSNPTPDSPQPDCAATALYDPRNGSLTTGSSMLRCGNNGSSFTLLLDGTVLKTGGSDCNLDVCVPTGSAELYVPAGVSAPPLPAFPPPSPAVFPSPTPRPTPLPPAAGPVPPNARSWTVTVDNRSSEPATLFVAEEEDDGSLRLVGSATPNVVPAGATAKVTFLFPAKGGPDDGWIYVNPRPGEGASLLGAGDIGTRGKILIGAEGDGGWLSP